MTKRKVLSQIFNNEIDGGKLNGYIAGADSFIDDAFDLLEKDEPSLSQWLESNADLNHALGVTISAIYKIIATEAMEGKPLHMSRGKSSVLLRRLLYAVAVHATMNERPDIHKELKFER